jgi:hypothetical protein
MVPAPPRLAPRAAPGASGPSLLALSPAVTLSGLHCPAAGGRRPPARGGPGVRPPAAPVAPACAARHPLAAPPCCPGQCPACPAALPQRPALPQPSPLSSPAQRSTRPPTESNPARAPGGPAPPPAAAAPTQRPAPPTSGRRAGPVPTLGPPALAPCPHCRPIHPFPRRLHTLCRRPRCPCNHPLFSYDESSREPWVGALRSSYTRGAGRGQGGGVRRGGPAGRGAAAGARCRGWAARGRRPAEDASGLGCG